jgi:ribosome-associated toxin RatA of RatAB toxin-antitoxin module
MIRTDERVSTAPPDILFRSAADVERWPEILPHYRWVRFHDKRGFGQGVVEMAAWRDFLGPIRYPTWWVSEMSADPGEPIVRYRHVDGITRRMDVSWEFLPDPGGTRVRIVHEWEGPAWPLIRRIAADHVIGPHFVSVIARRTLAGICTHAERGARTPEAGHHD